MSKQPKIKGTERKGKECKEESQRQPIPLLLVLLFIYLLFLSCGQTVGASGDKRVEDGVGIAAQKRRDGDVEHVRRHLADDLVHEELHLPPLVP